MGEGGWKFFALTRSALMATLFMGFTTMWLPWTLGVFRHDWVLAREGWRAMGWAPLIVGGALALWCVWEFGWTGRGTPAPFDPPRVLVVRGLYRFVRNPMYIAAGTFIAGEWMLLGRTNEAALWYGIGLVVACNVFVRAYEEPVLRSMFGADYERYCRNVRRWWPRVKPYEVPGAIAAGQR